MLTIKLFIGIHLQVAYSPLRFSQYFQHFLHQTTIFPLRRRNRPLLLLAMLLLLVLHERPLKNSIKGSIINAFGPFSCVNLLNRLLYA